MANMIPQKIRAEANDEEREVFRKLQSGPEDWVVIHSAHVPQGRNRNARELDFVILTGPSVIYLEVKGGAIRGRITNGTTVSANPRMIQLSRRAAACTP